VGIGTASPNNTLTVRGAQDAGIEVNSADSNSSRIITAYDPANTRFYINSTNSGSGTVLPLDFLIGNAAQYRIAASGVFSWYDGAGGTRMTLNSTGLGVGVTPSAWNSSYKAIQFGSGGAVSGHTSSSLPWFVASSNAFINSAGDWKYINNGYATRYLARGDDGTQSWSTSPSGSAGGTITFTQAMTLDASGNLLVGTTDTGSNSGIGIKSVYSSTAPYVSTVGSSNASNVYSYLLYSTTDAAFKFYVSYSGTVSATNGTISAISDARLKENVQDIDVGLSAILALKPRKFDWKAGKGKDIKGDRGFIAQEFEQVFPNLIDEWKDPAPEGEAPYKSVRQDLIPVLVKAIQELAAEVNALKNA
jgi:hypothetical protein